MPARIMRSQARSAGLFILKLIKLVSGAMLMFAWIGLVIWIIGKIIIMIGGSINTD